MGLELQKKARMGDVRRARVRLAWCVKGRLASGTRCRIAIREKMSIDGLIMIRFGTDHE